MRSKRGFQRLKFRGFFGEPALAVKMTPTLGSGARSHRFKLAAGCDSAADSAAVRGSRWPFMVGSESGCVSCVFVIATLPALLSSAVVCCIELPLKLRSNFVLIVPRG